MTDQTEDQPGLGDFDHRVATALRADTPSAVIAEKEGCSLADVRESIERMISAGVVKHDGSKWIVRNVVAGYQQNRDDSGLTERYRVVRDGIRAKKTQKDIAAELGVTKQRVGQIVKDLREKGVLRG